MPEKAGSIDPAFFFSDDCRSQAAVACENPVSGMPEESKPSFDSGHTIQREPGPRWQGGFRHRPFPINGPPPSSSPSPKATRDFAESLIHREVQRPGPVVRSGTSVRHADQIVPDPVGTGPGQWRDAKSRCRPGKGNGRGSLHHGGQGVRQRIDADGRRGTLKQEQLAVPRPNSRPVADHHTSCIDRGCRVGNIDDLHRRAAHPDICNDINV